MNPSKLFRLILTASIILTIGGAIAEFGFETLLPQPLQDYLRMEADTDLKPPEIIIAVISIPFLITFIASYIGLYLWKAWGRTLFLVTSVFTFVLTPFMGPYVYSGITITFYELASVLYGMILALAYFSPVAANFQKRKNVEQALSPTDHSH